MIENQERGKMSNNYEQDQGKVLETINQTVQTAVTTGVNWWLSRPKSVKIEVSTPQIPTVSKDIERASEAIAEGASMEEVISIIGKGEIAQKVNKNVGNLEGYSNLIAKAAQIQEAVRQKTQVENPNLQQNINKSKGIS